MADILKISGLTAGYGPLRVLHEIDFRVGEGERVGLVGLNGHGKTTLFRAISSLVGTLGLLPGEPDANAWLAISGISSSQRSRVMP